MQEPAGISSDDGQDRLLAFALAGLLLIAACLVWILVTAGEDRAPDGGAGQTGAAVEFLPVAAGVAVLHAATLSVFVLFLALGVRRDRRRRWTVTFLAVQLALLLANWWALLWTYQTYLETGSLSYLMGLPLPTTLMLLGTWLSALPLLVLYVWRFRTVFYSDQDEARFQALVSEFSDRSGSDSRHV